MEYTFKVLIAKGLHARPCVKLVSILEGCRNVVITCNKRSVDSLSILELLLLKINYESEVVIISEIPLSDTVITELNKLFGDYLA